MKKAEQIMDDLWELLGPRLKEAAGDDSSQVKLAKQIGVSQTTVGRWINDQNRRGVKFESVMKALKAVGVSMDEVARVIFDSDQIEAGKLMLEKDPDSFKKLTELIKRGDEYYELLISQLEILYERATKNK